MKVLLVDDSIDMRKLVELFLKSMSHEVIVAKHGGEAIELVEAQEFDIILMDMRMPIVDGYEATATIRQKEEEGGKVRTPVIALTSFSMKDEINKSLAAGCDCHLVKPVNRAALEKVLADYKKKPAGKEDKKSEPEGLDSAFYNVVIDEEIKDLVPNYLDKRKTDLETMKSYLERDLFDELRSLGHKIKGSGGGYGFQGLSVLGARIEQAGKNSDKAKLDHAIHLYADFLEKVEIRYE